MKRHLMCCLILLVLFLSTLSFSAEPTELITNGSFDQWADGRPMGWTMEFGATEGEGPESIISQAMGRDGTGHSLMLSGDSETRMWYAASQNIAVVPGDRVTVSGWMHTEDVRSDGHKYSNCHLTLLGLDAAGQRTGIWPIGKSEGTTDWSFKEQTIQVPERTAELAIYCFLSMSGTVRFDDISVVGTKPPEANADLPRDDQWRADLAFLVDSLVELHVNPFTVTTEEVFRARAASIETEIPNQSDLELTLRFMALVASLGDAHTAIRLDRALPRMPIALGYFEDDLRVLAIDRSFADLAGGRVVRLGDRELSDVLDYLRLLLAHENEWWFRYRAPRVLNLVDILDGLKITPTRGELMVTVLNDAGEEVTATLVRPEEGGQGDLLTMKPAADDVPFYLSHKTLYWFEYLEDSGTFYLQYNQCWDDPDYPVAVFTKDVLAAVDSLQVDRFVLDLRQNRGGNSSLLDPLIAAVGERRTAEKIGPCFVITGPATFSSGTLNALDFRRMTKALVVGEPMGNKPNHYGQPSTFELPNSGLPVYYSTKHFVRLEGDPATLEPDIPAAQTWNDYLAGRDPALEAILESPSP